MVSYGRAHLPYMACSNFWPQPSEERKGSPLVCAALPFLSSPMLNLFSGGPAAPAANARAGAAAAKPHQRKNVAGQAAGLVASTVAASEVVLAEKGRGSPAPQRAAHAFSGPDVEAILSLRRLLVKLVAAKDLPDSQGARRSCVAEVELVDELGGRLGGSAIGGGVGGFEVLHEKTGPPNHFSTVKDTAPVWNAEFVAELPSDLAASGLALRIAVWDEACSPPAALGECLIHANELATVCMREEERTLPLEHPSPPSAAGAMLGASGMLATTSGTATPHFLTCVNRIEVVVILNEVPGGSLVQKTTVFCAGILAMRMSWRRRQETAFM